MSHHSYTGSSRLFLVVAGWEMIRMMCNSHQAATISLGKKIDWYEYLATVHRRRPLTVTNYVILGDFRYKILSGVAVQSSYQRSPAVPFSNQRFSFSGSERKCKSR